MVVPASLSIASFRQTEGPLVDVRSPGEFAKGHWPGAINLPLFSDQERAEVGTIYKQRGRRQAIQRGLAITGPKLADLSEGLQRCVNTNSDSALRLYCWRGGMRSGSLAWLADLVDLKPVLLDGGYKSYRRWVLERFEQIWPLRLLAGRTGTGKTDLLLALARRGVAVVDLEGLAHHRGSSFGGLGMPPQPSTEHYENRLAEVLERCRKEAAQEIWLEAESSRVGRCNIPAALFKQMQAAPLLEIRRTLQERVDRLVDVYGLQGRELLQAATLRISKRLGPQRTQQAMDALEIDRWDLACEAMLDYYDRCYDSELARDPDRNSADLAGFGCDEAAAMLLEKGLMRPCSGSPQGDTPLKITAY